MRSVRQGIRSMKRKLLTCVIGCFFAMNAVHSNADAADDSVHRALEHNAQYLELMREEVGLTESQLATVRQILFACIQTLESDTLEHRRRLFRTLANGAVTNVDDLGYLGIHSDGQLITRRFGVILASLFENKDQRAKMEAFLRNNGFRYAIGWASNHVGVSLPNHDVPLGLRRPPPPRQVNTRNAEYEALIREYVNLNDEQFSAIRDVLHEYRMAMLAARITQREAAVGRLLLANADEFVEQHQWFCLDVGALRKTIAIPYARRLIVLCPDEASKAKMRSFLVEHGLLSVAGDMTSRIGFDLSDLAESEHQE